jgi:hypothetical protein
MIGFECVKSDWRGFRQRGNMRNKGVKDRKAIR